jgi:hypothetical protein
VDEISPAFLPCSFAVMLEANELHRCCLTRVSLSPIKVALGAAMPLHGP